MKQKAPALLLTALVIGTCGLIYELLAGTLASYVLGDSVTQFSLIIGVYLFAMGIGAWLSGFVDRELVTRFVEIEIGVALLGGSSAAILFLAFSRVSFFLGVLYGVVLLIGILVGLEIPLLMRILKDQYELKDLVSRVLTVDYLGALLASLFFPMFLVPKLGLIRGAFAVGLLNGVVALGCTWVLADLVPRRGRLLLLRAEALLTLALLSAGLYGADWLTSLSEDQLYADPVVFAESSPYQRLVVTEGKGGFQLYLNGHLQFASVDEHRYHEALVHPAVGVVRDRGRAPRRALVLGGGDGLAVRELLRHPGLEQVVLIDLDEAVTRLARTLPPLVEQNLDALADPRVQVVNGDAMIWLRDEASKVEPFDVLVIDFPDPSSFGLGKLYTTRFYRLAKRALAEDGALVVQSTSPLYARRSFWCVATTLEASGFFARAYHASVPSFGDWGYVLASPRPFDVPSLPSGPTYRFLTPELLPTLFVFGADTGRLPAEVNSLNNQVLVRYYEEEWDRTTH
ncbi:MAG: polyamine aminopropyltransferase [Deltaproteobacteria bacterium]|nr:polyamine aminopropyltransferase [Deltaproteobacteria bacterium]